MPIPPTQGPNPVRRGDPIRAADHNAVVARLASLGGFIAKSAGMGGRGSGVGPPSVRLDGNGGEWGGWALQGLWGRVKEVHRPAGTGPVRGALVRYTAQPVYRGESARLVNVWPYFGRDWEEATPEDETPLIIPADIGDPCVIVRDVDAEGVRRARLWILTERLVRRVCGTTPDNP